MNDQNQVEILRLPEYRCHKKVIALKIAALEVHQNKSATIAPDEDEFPVFLTAPGWADRFKGDKDDLGYYVVYQDGYTSWSPTKAFEDGYTRIEE